MCSFTASRFYHSGVCDFIPLLMFMFISMQGISRSAAVVIAYLIRNHGMSYDAAFAFVKRQRACIKPNTGFVNALKEWESSWHRPVMGNRRFTT